jgi:cytochrome c-type biogenesis protein CcmH/NrfG
LRWFGQAIDLTPDNVEAYSSLGDALFMKGDFEESTAAYQASLDLKPTAMTLASIGDVKYHQGKYEQAYLLHQQAVEKAPGNYLCWSKLGHTRRQLYRHDEGTDEIFDTTAQLARKSLVVNPRDAMAWLVLAQALAYLNRSDEALLALRRSIELAPENLAIKYQSAIVWNELDDSGRALEALTEAVKGGYSMHVIVSNPELSEHTARERFKTFSARHKVSGAS